MVSEERMGAISIRGVDDELTRRLKEEAETAHKSLNQLVIDIMKQLNIMIWMKLFGQWSEDEFTAIQGKMDSERQVDEELWK